MRRTRAVDFALDGCRLGYAGCGRLNGVNTPLFGPSGVDGGRA